AKLDEIQVTGPVDGICYDADYDRIYADHDDGAEVWVIDAATDKILGAVSVPGAPEFIEFDPASHRIYQNIKANDTIQVIDPQSMTVAAVWPTAPASSPHGMAIDRKTQRLFTAGSNGKLTVIDMKTGKPITSVDIATGVDQIVFDAGLKRVYCSCRNAISIVQETAAGAASLGDVPAPAGAHTITVDPRTHAVWTCYTDKSNSYLQRYDLVK
ncbi:MAG TPA: YncE family protein, partial [Chthonomonadales bacterium]|nr:YncE family protein [Chthonomonadales bacterium]